MSDEPKTLTLEEALAELGRKDYALKMDPDAPGRPDPETGEYLPRWGVLNADGLVRSFGDTWAEAVSKALGVPVVARDEAAELRDQVEELTGAVRYLRKSLQDLLAPEVLRNLTGTYLRSDLEQADKAVSGARVSLAASDSLLRRLAGGEEQP